MKKSLNEIISAFSDLDKIMSNTLLYFGSVCGFIFGWVSLAIILVSIGTGISPILQVILRIFYFLLAFITGLKLILYGLKLAQRYSGN